MQKLLLKNADVISVNERSESVSILIEDGKISSLLNNETATAEMIFDLTDHIVFAGFIDAHIHGAVGVDVNTATVDDLYKMAKFLAEQGTTAWLPTFVPDADETYRNVIAEIEKIIGIQENEPIAQIVGVHYEGVFANEKMCG
ncbi:MAG: hypothetical protein ABIP06_12360, partial [Pyrinomonadaceae bacterium]